MSPMKAFHPLIQKWFNQKYSNPTPVQALAWPHIQEKKNLLITAPTGGGKTLAAFLWAIDDFLTQRLNLGSVKVLYISPLKALNRDVSLNLQDPLEELKELAALEEQTIPHIRVKTRSGDTPQKDRRKMLSQPPEILISTPESLHLILTSPQARNILSEVKVVILDEIHSLYSSKRGTQLITSIERLTLLAGEFQRIALSATIRPLEKVADFIGGYQMIKQGDSLKYKKRDVQIIDAKSPKAMDLTLEYPLSPETEFNEDNIWPLIVAQIKKQIFQNRSTLIFTNSRKISEMLARMINQDENEVLAYAHHGSLSKEIRQNVEERLKNGQLKAIVSTSSLELGIDVGVIDEVLLVQTPFTVSSAFQRIGRSGHRLSELTRGIFMPIHGMDILASAVMSKTMKQNKIETMHTPENALDVLAQTVLSMVSIGPWKIDELYAFIKTISSYHYLSQNLFDSVINMLCGKFENLRIPELKARLFIDHKRGEVFTKDGTRSLIYMSGGTIPDRGYFDLIIEGSRSGKIGELDEEFVWERKIGHTFVLGTQTWKITAMDDQKVSVVPHSGPISTLPFWKADQDTRDSFFSQQKASFLKEWEEKQCKTEWNWVEIFKQDYAMNSASAASLQYFLLSQKEATRVMPHSRRILFEYTRGRDNSGLERVIIFTFWGSAVNTPLAYALKALWQKLQGFQIEVFSDSIAVMLLMPHDLKATELLERLIHENVEMLLKEVLETTGFFGSHFRQNSQRALLTPRLGFNKRLPLWFNRLRSKKLFSAAQGLPDFPMIIETWRSCLQDEFNLEDLKNKLSEIEAGEIEIVVAETEQPSPFSANLIFRQTDLHMYQTDAPFTEGKSNISDNLFEEILQTKLFRPRIPRHSFEKYLDRVYRNHAGFTPSNHLDFLELINDLVIVPERMIHWDCSDTQLQINQWLKELKGKVFHVFFKSGENDFYICPEALLDIARGLSLSQNEIGFLFPQECPDDFSKKLRKASKNETGDSYPVVLYNWINLGGPINENNIKALLGKNNASIIKSHLQSFIDDDELLYFPVIEEENEPWFLTPRVYEILLRVKRRDQQPGIEALESNFLPDFMAQHQGLFAGKKLEMKEIMPYLFGFPLSAEAWEKDILPCRVDNYNQNMLDSYLNSSQTSWVGFKNNSIYFSPPCDLDIYLKNQNPKDNNEFPEYFSFWDLKDKTRFDSHQTAELIWKGFWKEKISNNNFNTIRMGIENKFQTSKAENKSDLTIGKQITVNLSARRSKRMGYRQWASQHQEQGLWYSLNKYLSPIQSLDSIEEEEIRKDQISQIILRYGFIAKEFLQRESKMDDWKTLFPTLRRMELSGEIVGGYFFKDLSLPQFTVAQHIKYFRDYKKANRIFWLSTQDPLSPCGLGLKEAKWSQDLPTRGPNHYLIFKSDTLAAHYNSHSGKIFFALPAEDPRLLELKGFFEFLLTRDYKALSTVKINLINDEPLSQSPYLKMLGQLGFIKERLMLVLRGRPY
ncbi:MAG: DEAD/DEAH box helicase [Spirochaetales bacterium]|nr:DEAD/DEAH box helicase [Spirochaetales bacterium]